MTAITASLVKDLREKTGAGMMDAKKALVETGGNMEAAVDALRAKGLAKAGKKAGRATGEGVVAMALAADGLSGALAEVNCETDFVARNADFQSLAAKAAAEVLANGNADALSGEVANLIATIGENMAVRRAARLSVTQGLVAGYAHAALAPGIGRIGVLVALEGPGDLAAAARQLALHVAAANPSALDRAALPAEAVERERAVLRAQAAESGKPPAIVEKMVEGRLKQFYAERCLLEQALVTNPDVTVGAFLESAAPGARVAGFARLALGEGAEAADDAAA
ncbi:MAG TPA: translation elongation factor Ts [Rhodospirillaceae bacterium]|jgi:elongation factor Ts|nr:translation elongation factor Ts [Alphaproteobacteria bacterium]HBH27074.1 translation elongation factor Ts [Rhodospirillaceae bacterium]